MEGGQNPQDSGVKDILKVPVADTPDISQTGSSSGSGSRILSGETPEGLNSAESMIQAVRTVGIIPFFRNAVKGFSIQDMTARGYWFNDPETELGPWDWKIDAVRTGEIAYGKFLLGGKASFATVQWYRELMNYRRAQKKYQPEGLDLDVFNAIREAGTISPSELRKSFKLKKNQIDSIITRLEMDTLVVVGDITRVYRGPDLHYNGWQRSSVCRPDSLFETDESPARSAEDSYRILSDRIRAFFPDAAESQIRKILS